MERSLASGSSGKHRRAYEAYELDDDVSNESLSRRKKRIAADAIDEQQIGGKEITHYCGYEGGSNVKRIFGAVFPKHSYPIDASSFTQIDGHRWFLEMGEGYDEVTEMCIFLINEYSLPPDKALAVYVQAPGSQFQYCGAVCNTCPSALVTLLWPNHRHSHHHQHQHHHHHDYHNDLHLISSGFGGAGSAKVGVAAEDLASLPVLNVRNYHRMEQLGLRIGENLFNFIQSFSAASAAAAAVVSSDRLVVPLNALDEWFKKLRDKSRKDPDYLKQFTSFMM